MLFGDLVELHGDRALQAHGAHRPIGRLWLLGIDCLRWGISGLQWGVSRLRLGIRGLRCGLGGEVPPGAVGGGAGASTTVMWTVVADCWGGEAWGWA